jgi:proteic killer suppression protein
MRIRSFRHKGLRGLIEDDDTSGIRQDLVKRVRRVVTALVLAEDISKLLAPPGWRIHQLSGDRAGEWSVSVSGNWRIAFEVRDDEIWSLNLEDYH